MSQLTEKLIHDKARLIDENARMARQVARLEEENYRLREWIARQQKEVAKTIEPPPFEEDSPTTNKM